jgi:kumamolisin
MNAVRYVNNQTSSDIVSMSWGSNESSDYKSFSTLFNKQSTCYLAASGDTASLVNLPSCLQDVLSCGGTTLSFTNNVRSESCWSDAGCGISKYIQKPLFQNNISVLNNISNRSTPDICAVADPTTGVFVCFQKNFYQIGGTSLSCPLIAGILSISVQDRINKKKTSLTTIVKNGNSLQLQNKLYSLNQNVSSVKYLNDINSGTNGKYSAQKGFDICTGLGSINAGNVIAYLSTL